MMQSYARDFLDNAPLFMGLSSEQIDAVFNCTERAWFDTGEALTQAGDPGAAAFMVLSGSVMVADACEASGYQDPLGPGTFIGELAMLTEVDYAATVVAAEPVSALVIERDALYRVLEADPAIAEHISDKLTLRLTSLTAELRMVDERFEALENSLQRASKAA